MGARTAPVRRRGARVVIAPDSFKGSLSADEVARAIAAGWRERRPQDAVTLVPLADGGEGTLDALVTARPDAQRQLVRVTGPDDAQHDAEWLLIPGADPGCSPGSRHAIGVVELAATSGIELLREARPLDAHSLGFGEAIRAALEAGVDELILGIGSSASTDGGAAVLRALGANLLDAHGEPIPLGARGLPRIARVDLTGLIPLPRGGVTVLSDVSAPLTGTRGAARVFGPQKGLVEPWVTSTDEALERYASLVVAARAAAGQGHGVPAEDLAVTAGAGAAGGVGFALLAWGAQLVPGADRVADLLGLAAACSDADVVITGEGRFDAQSRMGKAVSAVLTSSAGRRLGLVAGQIAPGSGLDEFFAAESLTELASSPEAAMADPWRFLRAAGIRLAERLTPERYANSQNREWCLP